MLLIAQVVDRPAVAEMHVVDHADLLERLERAIDGRDVDAREPSVDVAREFVGSDVSVGADNCLDDDLPGRGTAPTGSRESIEDVVCIHEQLQSYGK